MVVSTKIVVRWYVTPYSLAHVDHTAMFPSSRLLCRNLTIPFTSFVKDGSMFEMCWQYIDVLRTKFNQNYKDPVRTAQ